MNEEGLKYFKEHNDRWIPAEDCCRPVDNDNAPMCVALNDLSALAMDALASVYRINQHLFGLDEPKGELPKTNCMQDVIMQNVFVLKRTNEALYVLMNKLGV